MKKFFIVLFPCISLILANFFLRLFDTAYEK